MMGRKLAREADAFWNLVGQAKDAARDIAAQASKAAGQAGDIARDALRAGRERLPGADEAYRRGNEAVRGRVEEAPLVALVAAFGVGYLLGLLVHGRD